MIMTLSSLKLFTPEVNKYTVILQSFNICSYYDLYLNCLI